jgi:tetratricopeptide (TPR) repeat protein
MERAWCALGEVCRSQAKWPEAAEAYRGLFALDKPPSLERLTAAVGLAGALVKLGAPAEALDMLENLVPSEWPLVSMHAAERAKLEGRAAVYRAAAARAAVGADIGPLMAALADHCDKHPGAREAVARACDEMGNRAAAAAVWARVAADDPALLPNLAASRMAAGDVAGGIAAFEAAVVAAPHDAAMVANLAQALAMAGRFDESRANYARAIRIAESSDVSADLIRRWREQQATVGGSEGRVR